VPFGVSKRGSRKLSGFGPLRPDDAGRQAPLGHLTPSVRFAFPDHPARRPITQIGWRIPMNPERGRRCLAALCAAMAFNRRWILPTLRCAVDSAIYAATDSGAAGSAPAPRASHHSQKSRQSLRYPRRVLSALLWRANSRACSSGERLFRGRTGFAVRCGPDSLLVFDSVYESLTRTGTEYTAPVRFSRSNADLFSFQLSVTMRAREDYLARFAAFNSRRSPPPAPHHRRRPWVPSAHKLANSGGRF
jgi:hypothetical protein